MGHLLLPLAQLARAVAITSLARKSQARRTAAAASISCLVGAVMVATCQLLQARAWARLPSRYDAAIGDSARLATLDDLEHVNTFAAEGWGVESHALAMALTAVAFRRERRLSAAAGLSSALFLLGYLNRDRRCALAGSILSSAAVASLR